MGARGGTPVNLETRRNHSRFVCFIHEWDRAAAVSYLKMSPSPNSWCMRALLWSSLKQSRGGRACGTAIPDKGAVLSGICLSIELGGGGLCLESSMGLSFLGFGSKTPPTYSMSAPGLCRTSCLKLSVCSSSAPNRLILSGLRTLCNKSKEWEKTFLLVDVNIEDEFVNYKNRTETNVMISSKKHFALCESL